MLGYRVVVVRTLQQLSDILRLGVTRTVAKELKQLREPFISHQVLLRPGKGKGSWFLALSSATINVSLLTLNRIWMIVFDVRPYWRN